MKWYNKNISIARFLKSVLVGLIILSNGTALSQITVVIEGTGGATSVCQGTTFVLTVNATGGTYTYINYTWSGDTGPITVISDGVVSFNTNAAPGIYNLSCLVDDDGGNSGTGNISITLLPSPEASITAGGPTTFCDGNSVDLSANTGSGLTYQWRTGASDIAGETNSTYTATQTGVYRVKVTNSDLCFKLSNIITTIVNPLPGPSAGNDGPVCDNGTINLTSGPGGMISYSWTSNSITPYTSTDQNPSITNITSDFSGDYTVKLTDGNGCENTATTSILVFNVLNGGTITANQTVCNGGDPAAFTSTLAPSGGNGAWSYSWESKIGAGAWTPIPGAIALFYDVPGGITQTTDYQRVASNACGTVFSNTISITVSAIPEGGTIATDQTVCYNGDPAAFTSTIDPSGGNGAWTYSWESKIGAGAWTTIAGAAALNYDALSGITQITDYRRTATNNCGTVISNTLTLSVYSILDGGTISTDQNVCNGGDPAGFTSTIAPSGGNGAWTYSWESKIGAGAWTPIAGAGALSYDIPVGISQTTDYRRAATNSCGTVFSDTVTVTVYTFLDGGTIAANQIVCNGGDPAAFTSTLAPSGGNGAWTYSWESKIGAGAWTPIPGAIALFYDVPGGITQTTDYQRVASNACGTVFSNTISITVSAIPDGGTIATDQTICYNGDPAAFSSTIDPSGGNGAWTYSWESKIGAGAWTTIAGAAALNYDAPSGITQITDYRRTAANNCGTVISNTVTLSVYSILDGGTIATDQNVCNGGDPANFTSAIDPSGGNGAWTYSWESKIGAGAWTPIAGAGALSYDIPPGITQTTDYRREATNSCGSVISDTLTLTVYAILDGGSIATDQFVCDGGDPAAFTSITDPSGGNGAWVYSWESKTGAGPFIPIAGASALTYDIPSGIAQTTQYKRGATNNCGTAYSNTNTITVNPLPATPTISADGPVTFCEGGSVNFSSSAGTSYIWSNGATTQAINITTSGSYTVQVTDANACLSASSAAMAVTVNPAPTPVITGTNNVCKDDTENYSTASVSGNTYLWSSSPEGTMTSVNTANPVTIQWGTVGTGSVSLTETITSTGCTLTTAAYPVTVYIGIPAIAPALVTGPLTGCQDGTLNVEVSDVPTAASYTWDYSWIAGTNDATTPTVQIAIDLAGLAIGTYDVTAAGTNGCGIGPWMAPFHSFTIITLPATPTISSDGPTSFCAGGSVNLSSSAGTGYLWSNGATTQSINVSATGSYTVQVMDTSGCLSVASAAIIVTVNALPATPSVSADGPITFCAGGSVNLSSEPGTSYLWSNGATTQSINITAQGNYTVQVSDASACQSSSSAVTLVTVNALPVTPIISADGPTSFCTGDSVTLTPGSGTSYLWSTGATSAGINVNTTGSYTVQVTNAAGCLSAASAPAAVTVNAIPVISGSLDVCAGSTTQLTGSATAAAVAPWVSASTGIATINISGLLTGVSAGTSLISYTNNNGCISTATVSVNALPLVDAGIDATIPNGTNTTLDATVTGAAPFNYSWTPIVQFADATVEDPATVNLAATTVFTLSAASTITSCSDADMVTITINGGALSSAPTAVPSSVCPGVAVQLIANAGGGSGVYTYTWTSNPVGFSSLIANPVVNPVVSTTYNVAVSDGATTVNSQVSVTIIALPATPSISADGPTTFCSGGSVNLSSDAGSSYLWSNGATTQSLNISTAGSYSVQVSNAGGCLSAASSATMVTINALPVTPTISADGPTSFCTGDSVTLTPGSGTSYLWSTGETSAGINVNTTGSYTVQVTNAAGCLSAASAPAVVTVNAIPVISGILNVCIGSTTQLTGSATSAAVTPWVSASTGIATINISGLLTGVSAGTSLITYTNNNGCISTATVSVNALPLVDAGIDATIPNGTNTTLDATVTGTAPFNYSWTPFVQFADATIEDPVTVNLAATTVFTLSAASTTTSCSNADIVTITISGGALSSAPAAVPASVCPGAAVQLIANAGGGSGVYSYTWTSNPVGFSSLMANPIVNPMVTTTYNVAVFDGATTVNSQVSVTIIALPATPVISADGPTTFCSGGSVNLSSDAGTSYLWSNGATTQNVNISTAGIYSVQVSNAGGCFSAASAATAVSVNSAITWDSVTISDVLCHDETNGKIEIAISGVPPPYTYSNDNGSNFVNNAGIFDNLAAATYNLAVKDGNNCIAYTTATVTQPSLLINNITNQVNISCNGSSDGSVIVDGSGGTSAYTYNIDGNSFGPSGTFIGLNPGSHIAQVKDANNCLANLDVNITQPSALLSVADKTDITCNGNNDGTATITASGGTSPYTYSKNPAPYQPSNVFGGLNKTTFTFITKDARGCLNSNTVTILEPLTPALLITSEIKIDNNVCFGDSLGEIRVFTVTGGVMPYEYSIDGGLNFYPGSDFQGLSAGSYQTTVRDAAGCSKNGNLNTISQPGNIYVTSYSQVDVSNCFGNTDGQISIQASGGTGVLSYDLDGLVNNTNGLFTTIGGGNHIVTMIDTKSCSIDTIVNLSQPSEQVFTSLTVTNVTGCNGDSNGTVDAVAGGGAGSYNYSFNNKAFQASGSFNGLTSGIYKLSVRDALNCIKDSFITISEPAPLSILSQNSENVKCISANDGTISIIAAGGSSSYTYILNPGALMTNTTGSFTLLSPGTFNVTITDNQGCGPINTLPIVITEPTQLVSDSVVSKNISCEGSDNAEIHFFASGGTIPYSYSIDNKLSYGLARDFTGLSAGNYLLSIKDNNGCFLDNGSVNFTEPSVIIFGSESKKNIISCSNDTTGELDYSVSGGTGNLEYSIDGLNWKSSGTFTGLNSGSYIVTARDQNLCSLNSSNLTITAPVAITAIITATPDLNEFNKGTISIINPSGGTGTLEYSVSGPTGTFGSQTNYTGLDAGTYPVVIRDDNNCTFQQDVIVSLITPLNVTVSLTNSTCKGDNDASINMVCSNGSALIEYSIDDSVSWVNNGSFTDLSPGTYFIFTRDGQNRYFQDTVLLTEPLAINIFGSVTPPSCSSLTSDGAINVSVNGGSSPYAYKWISGEITQDLSNIPPGNYTITVTDSKSCSSVKSFLLSAISTVTADAGPDTTLCFGQSFILNGQGGVVYSWSPSQGLSNPNISNPVVSITTNKSYVLTVVGFNDCIYMDTIDIFVQATLSLSAGEDTLIIKDQEAMLVASGSSFVSYSWQPSTGLDNPDQSSTLAHPLVNTNYILTAVSEFGCIEKDTVTVRIANRVIVYDVFSPNNDNQNDFFDIGFANLYPDILVEVFTRWGEKIFSTTGYNDEQRWDGTYKNKELPMGTYYYVIVPYAGAEALAGPITIVR